MHYCFSIKGVYQKVHGCVSIQGVYKKVCIIIVFVSLVCMIIF